MTLNEINEICNNEMLAFNNKKYDGSILPEDLVQKFRMALMIKQIDRPALAKEIIAKQVDDLSWLEVGVIVTHLRDKNIPYERLYDTIEEALDYQLVLMDHVMKYNEIANEVNRQITEKRERMCKLNGITGAAMYN